MTFTEMVTAVQNRLNLSSSEASTRIGTEINSRYQRVVSEVGLNVAQRVVAVSANTSLGLATVTFTGIEKIERLYDDRSGSIIILQEISFDELRQSNPDASDSPTQYAIQTMGPSSVVVRLNVLAQTVFALKADGLDTTDTLSGSQQPQLPTNFHYILVEGVIADELLKAEKESLAKAAEALYSQGLSKLKLFIAQSTSRSTRQGSQLASTASSSGAGGGGSAPSGGTSYTQSGLVTFDRDPSAPFAVTSGSAKVDNLDADKLDGSDSTAFALLAGRAAGQTLIGGTAASENLTLQSTAHATRGNIATVDKVAVTRTVTNAQAISAILGLGAEATASVLRVQAYSPAIEWMDKDSLQNWFIGIDDNDGDAFVFGRGYGPGQGVQISMRMDPASGDVGVGPTRLGAQFDVDSDNDWCAWFRHEGTGANNESLIRHEHFSDNQVPLPIITGIGSRGTRASSTTLSANDYLLVLDGRGYDGSAVDHSEYRVGVSDTAAQIAMRAGSTWSGTNHESYISLKTTPNGLITPAEAVRVGSDGLLSVLLAGIKERGRTTALGEWIAVTHAGGNFTANGAMTWTVASGDQITFAYTLIGKTMTVAFTIRTSTVGGTPDSQLRIAIPGGFTAAREVFNAVRIKDNATGVLGVASVGASGTTININRQDDANFSAATDATSVEGQITFEVA